MDVRDQLELLLSQRAALESLLSDKGWELFYTFLQGQVRANRNLDAGMQLTTFDSALVLANTRGRIEGLQVAIGLPAAMLADLARDIEDVQAELETEEHPNEGQSND